VAINKIYEEELSQISEILANKIFDYIVGKLDEQYIYSLDISVNFSKKDNKYILNLDVYIDISPFAGVNPKELIEEAIEYGLKIVKNTLKGKGVNEVE